MFTMYLTLYGAICDHFADTFEKVHKLKLFDAEMSVGWAIGMFAIQTIGFFAITVYLDHRRIS